MMKTRVWSILLVTCLVLTCGCIGNNQKNNKETTSTTSSTLMSPTTSNECTPLRENSEERNRCFYKLALDRKDVSLCNGVSLTLINPDLKPEDGKKIMTPTGGIDPSGRLIPVDVPHRAQCQKDVAILTGDSGICDDIRVYLSIQKECYFELAKKLKDVSICEKLPEKKGITGKSRSECYKELTT